MQSYIFMPSCHRLFMHACTPANSVLHVFGVIMLVLVISVFTVYRWRVFKMGKTYITKGKLSFSQLTLTGLLVRNGSNIEGNQYRFYTSKTYCWWVIAWVKFLWQRTFESTTFVRLDRISISLQWLQKLYFFACEKQLTHVHTLESAKKFLERWECTPSKGSSINGVIQFWANLTTLQTL